MTGTPTSQQSSLFDDASCPKCGGSEIRWRWHKTNWAGSRRNPACGYGDNVQPPGEHQHAYCQRCQYDWFEDVIANA